MAVEDAMKIAQLESDVHELSAKLNMTRHIIAGALCAVCGDPLGDEPIEHDGGTTFHQRCEGERDDG